MMSYNKEIAMNLKNYPRVLTQMADILKDSQKVKVLRMIVATFVNLLSNSSSSEALVREYTLMMLTYKVQRALELIMQTHCDKEKTNEKDLDEDLTHDCEVLQRALIEAEAKLSSFDEYVG